MSEFHYNLVKKLYADKIIGKAKIHRYIFYLIKWKNTVNRDISWQPSQAFRGMSKQVKQINNKIKNKELPFVQEQFRQEGLQLLKNFDQKKNEQKKNLKIEKIIGKCQLNNQLHYFIKWKDRSIFQSDWITKLGFYPLFRHELKFFNKKVKNFNLPCLDKNSFQQYLKIERFAFLNDPRFKSNSDLILRLKKEKIIEKIVKKQQHVKTECNEKSNEEIISDLIIELREKFYRAIENLYIPIQRNKVKVQDSWLDSTTEFFDSNTDQISQQNQLPEIGQLKSQTQKNKLLIKNTKSQIPSEQESEGDSSESIEYDPYDLKLRAKNQTKKTNLKQSQSYMKSQNNISFRPQQKERSKLEPVIFSQNNQSKNIKQMSRNYSFGCKKAQHIKSGDSPFPKSIFFEFNGQLSQIFTFDSHSLNKSYDSLSHQNLKQKTLNIFQQNSQKQKFEFKKEKQSQFLTFIPNKHQECHNSSSFCSQGDSLETSGSIKENQKEKKVRKIVITKKKTEYLSPQEEKQKDQENQVKKTENKQKIISIRLFAEDISSLQSSQQKQNLYEVIFAKPQQITSTIKGHKSQTKSQYNEKDLGEHSFKERRFLETSYLKKHYNSDFLHFLELEIGRLKKQK